jgi:hypothetical protein
LAAFRKKSPRYTRKRVALAKERRSLEQKLAKRLRGPRQRAARNSDIKTIDCCRDILKIWGTGLSQLGFGKVRIDDLVNNLNAASDYIKNVSGTQPHRPKSNLKTCAQSLGIYFKTLTGFPLYEHVGTILSIAFPDRWLKEKSDQQLTARKLIGTLPSRNLRALEALDMHNDDTERRRYWKETYSEIGPLKIEPQRKASQVVSDTPP